MTKVKNYLSLVNFSHTLFAMPFAMSGFFIGITKGDPRAAFNYTMKVNGESLDLSQIESIGIKFVLVLCCMITARSAAMAFNRYLDRHFDAKNPRTAIREIPKGIISANSALRFTILSCFLFIVSSFLINRICFYLSPVALFVILFYSYTKRFTFL